MHPVYLAYTLINKTQFVVDAFNLWAIQCEDWCIYLPFFLYREIQSLPSVLKGFDDNEKLYNINLFKSWRVLKVPVLNNMPDRDILLGAVFWIKI